MGRNTKLNNQSNWLPELYDFTALLSENNTRPWLAAHREQYDYLRSKWLEDLNRLLSLMTQWEPGLAGVTANRVTHRFARDTRFSPDKTPYKIFFSASISVHGKDAPYSGYYLHIGSPVSADNGCYGGIYCPPSPVIAKLRHAIVDNIEEFEQIISLPDIEKYYPDWVGEKLKTAPKGWPRDHKNIELLRLKDIGKFSPLSLSQLTSCDWVELANERFRMIKPLNDFIDYSIDE